MTPSLPATDLGHRFRAPGYLILALVALAPLIDLVVSASPIRTGPAAWRFQFLGAASSVTFIPLFALFLIYALANLFGDRRIGLTVAGLAAISVLVCLLSIGVFALDALEMRAQVRVEAVATFDLASAWAATKLLLAAIASLVLSIKAFRSSRELTRDVNRKASAKPSGLVVGHMAPKPPPARPEQPVSQA